MEEESVRWEGFEKQAGFEPGMKEQGSYERHSVKAM